MFISVVIIARNEEKTVESVINSVKSQKGLSSHFEIIVVSDGSKDRTVQKALSAGVKVISIKETSGVSIARNVGILEAMGDLILFLDAHIVINNRALCFFEKTFEKFPNVQGVCGWYSTPYRGLSAIRNIRYEIFSGKGDCFKLISLNNFSTFSAGISAVRRSVFDNVGFFDNRFAGKRGEDLFFEIKLLNDPGVLLAYEPRVKGVHNHKLGGIKDIIINGIKDVRGFYSNLFLCIDENLSLPLYDKYYFNFPFIMAVWFIFCLLEPELILLIILFPLATLPYIKVFRSKTDSVVEKISTMVYSVYIDVLKIFLFFPFIVKRRLQPEPLLIRTDIFVGEQSVRKDYFIDSTKDGVARPKYGQVFIVAKRFVRSLCLFTIWSLGLKKILDYR